MFRSQQVKTDQGDWKRQASGGPRKSGRRVGNEVWNRLSLGIPSISQTGISIQRQVTVGAPDDAFEREADRVADTVMRMPEPGGPGIEIGEESGASCLRRQPVEEEEEMLQPKAETASGPKRISESVSLREFRGRGGPLSKTSRDYFEPRFGKDFGAVRIHTGLKAESAAAAVRAKAFTSGTDIVFNKGKYSPENAEGRKLIAHELTHVVQQSA